MLGETKNQFSLTRVAPSTCVRQKSNFLSVKSNFSPFVLALTVGFSLASSLLQVFGAENYLFTTICGSPGQITSADGTNRNARFAGPLGIVVGPTGDLFVTEPYEHVIRKVSRIGSDWIVTTPLGTVGSYGTADGTNKQAQFGYPSDIAMDPLGALYVTDYSYHTIRKITPDGTNWLVTTIAGLAGVRGSADGTNNSARFNAPEGITVDAAGVVYVVDGGNYTLRRIENIGTNWVVSTLAGQVGVGGHIDGAAKTARFTSTRTIAVDSQTNLYVASNNGTIRRLTPDGTNWIVSTIAGMPWVAGSSDGTNGGARFFYPHGISVDGARTLYVTDSMNNTIRKITPSGTNWVVTTIGGLADFYGSADGTNSAARFHYPLGIALSRTGNLYIADHNNRTVREGSLSESPIQNLYPVAQCKIVFVFAGTNGTAEASTDDGSFDPEGGPLTVSAVPPGPYPLGTNWVTLIVTDTNGAASSCLGVVHVLDPTPPEIKPPSYPSRVSFNARTGQVVIVEVSTNLVEWSRLQTNTVGIHPCEFGDISSTNSPKRFYRLRLWP